VLTFSWPLAAGQCDTPDAHQALGKLCSTYWYPRYAFVRRQGKSPEDAEDLTQAFFARFLEKGSIELATSFLPVATFPKPRARAEAGITRFGRGRSAGDHHWVTHR
jgi:hypothetical protein